MMEPSCPVYDDIGRLGEDEVCSVDAATCCELAKVVQPFKPGVVKVLIDLEDRMHPGILPGLAVILHTAVLLNRLARQRVDPRFQIPHVMRVMEGLQLLWACFTEMVDVELFVQPVGVD